MGVYRPDVIRQPLEELSPIPSFPESEALHFDVVVAHRRIAIWCAVQIEINQLLQVRADDLIRINEDDFLQIHRKQHIEEQDLVRPDNPLFLLLSTQPRGPFVSDELILEAILLGEMRDKFLITDQAPDAEITADNEHSQGMTEIRNFR